MQTGRFPSRLFALARLLPGLADGQGLCAAYQSAYPKPYNGETIMLTQQVIQGDCKAVLQTLPNESVDFVLTDPPYLG